LISLNLPPFEYKLKKAEDKLWIFDIIRKKYVVLQPEEWVRQHFIHYLINQASCPRSLIKVEGGLIFNQLRKRSDIVVFDQRGKPWMIVECKSMDVQVNDNTLFQAATYNKTIQAPYLVVTNGMKHLYAHIDWALGSTQQLDSIPIFTSS
jgi:hypothetical protein